MEKTLCLLTLYVLISLWFTNYVWYTLYMRIYTSKYQHIIGKRYENTLVLSIQTQDIFICKCDCGNTHYVAGNVLVSGKTGRCKECRKPNKKHGQSHTRIYKIWLGIKSRCLNPNDTAYANYGLRGITMAESWKYSFENFFNDMYESYADDLVIDRIDTYGNYEKANCRWVSIKENTRNTRSNRWITIGNETKCVAEWAETYKIKPNTILTRILKYGWDDIAAVTTPIFQKPTTMSQTSQKEKDKALQREAADKAKQQQAKIDSANQKKR